MEKQNHLPLWTNEWNKVDSWQSNHDAGNVFTERDYQPSAAIDKLAGLKGVDALIIVPIALPGLCLYDTETTE